MEKPNIENILNSMIDWALPLDPPSYAIIKGRKEKILRYIDRLEKKLIKFTGKID